MKNLKLHNTFQKTGQSKRVNTRVIKIVMKMNTTIELPIMNPGKFTPCTTLTFLLFTPLNTPFHASNIFVLQSIRRFTIMTKKKSIETQTPIKKAIYAIEVMFKTVTFTVSSQLLNGLIIHLSICILKSENISLFPFQKNQKSIS